MHIQCLKHWISVKSSKKLNEQKVDNEFIGGAFHCDKLECQVCKAKLPKVIKINGQFFSLLNFIEEPKPFLGIKKMGNSTQKREEMSIYITMEEEKSVSIGRLYQNGVILEDQTVSRKHCVLNHTAKGFFIKDQKSKFGTLVYEKEAKCRIGRNKMKAFQINNSIFAFKLGESGTPHTSADSN